MIKELFPHQVHASKFLRIHKRGCLFHEVGTGKTNSAIAAVNQLPYGKLLILAPKCVCVGMWEKYDDLPINHDYQIVSYEWLSRHKEFKDNHFDYIICDECHKLKSRKSIAHKIVRIMARRSTTKYVWGLTGTPYATSFLDVHGIFEALNIKAFSQSYDSFLHTYYQCKVVYVNGGRFIYQPDKLLPGALEILTEKISEHASVLRAQDCLKLPELTIKEIEIPGMKTKEFTDAAKGIVTYADGHQETVNKLACVQKLHQLSNGFVYDVNKKPVIFKDNKKIQECMHLVEAELEERDKIIIVYIYQYDKECLQKALDNLKISYTDSFDDFCSKQVLVLQEQRAIGVNLQAFTSCMIFFTYSYAYLEYNQTVGRIYRAGQKIPCKIYVLINSGTSERKIWSAVQKAYDMDTIFKELMSEFRE
ncbi:MAG: DEAD/DEAH box helicase [Clostridia bacterium]|nr:DEAD/DEAH box helicase [Clostridia bacterium]